MYKKITLIKYLCFFIFLCIILGVYSKKLTSRSLLIETIVFNETKKISKKELEAEKKQEIQGILYTIDEKKQKLSSREISFSKDLSIEKRVDVIFKELNMEFLKNNIITKPITVKNIFIKDKNIYLNISSINFTNTTKSDSERLLLLYSISNSLISNTQQEKVKFLIDDEEKKGIYEPLYEKNINL